MADTENKHNVGESATDPVRFLLIGAAALLAPPAARSGTPLQKLNHILQHHHTRVETASYGVAS
jgi:hypothetical protein